ncbi:hypothetical protein DEO72_LG5g2062 [Vigna unguiculata]|uniref:Uncharacterized protein n=1 Tax=Vigna unguiculata TaxID=3917 RepID=A0A4D6M1R7_VIGUN|nr:hypothetical protein DEO72_LG5g2062 [Vigna unguiculata]
MQVQQRFHLARPTRRQAKLFQTAWRYPLSARRQRPPDLTVFSSPPSGAHRAARRLLSADPLAKAIAWRLSVDRQAPYQKHSAAGLWEVQKRIAEGLVLVCRLAGLFYPPGDDVGQP